MAAPPPHSNTCAGHSSPTDPYLILAEGGAEPRDKAGGSSRGGRNWGGCSPIGSASVLEKRRGERVGERRERKKNEMEKMEKIGEM